MTDKNHIADWFKELQDKICTELTLLDGSGRFIEDLWQRNEGGGGRTRIFDQGELIEKGGVNFSAVHGPTPTKILEALELEKADFFASGVSIVLHPYSPKVPIIHMNVRYFEMSNGTFWFGGGIDLTPHYIDQQLAKKFHRQLKNTCDQYSAEYYPHFKNWADDYFYVKHRNETRGIGGIFFDRLSENEHFSKEDRWKFVKGVGETFVPAYREQVEATRHLSYTEAEKEWQHLRRGRYVEFNLVWDKGTKFGLDTNGRTESILMSMPPMAQWTYDHQPAAGSKEAETLQWLRKGINWLK